MIHTKYIILISLLTLGIVLGIFCIMDVFGQPWDTWGPALKNITDTDGSPTGLPDTLEFGGDGTITDDGQGKYIVGFTSGGGWTDDGTVVRLTTSTDKVGIGTTAPLAKLHVVDNTTIQQALYFENTNASGYGVLFKTAGTGAGEYAFRVETGAASDAMRILNNNKVGIGVADPDTRLEIYEAGTQLKLSYDGANYATFAVAGDGALTVTTVDAVAAEGDIILMPDGNVGIGTTLPQQELHVLGDGIFSDEATSILLHDSGQDKGAFFHFSDNTESSGYGEWQIWPCDGPADACIIGDNPPWIWGDSTPKTWMPDLYLTAFSGGNESIDEILDDTINKGVLDAITVTDAGGINVSWSAGEVWDHANSKIVDTDAAGSTACTDDAINYLQWVSGTTLTLDTTAPTSEEVAVAVINVQDGDIYSIHENKIISQRESILEECLSSVFPVVVASGLIVSEHTAVNAFDVDCSAGIYHHDLFEQHNVASTIDSTSTSITRWYHDGSGNWTSDTNSQIDVTQYDTGTGLSAKVSNKYYRSVFFIVENDFVTSADTIHWVYPTTGTTTVTASIKGSDPALPVGLNNHPKSTAVVIREGDTAFPTAGGDQWIDVRPVLGQGISGDITDHGNLSGLSDDDHTIYSLADGTRAFTGDVTITDEASWLLLHDSGTNVGWYIHSSDTTESSGYGELQIWRCTGPADACTIGDNPPALWAGSGLDVSVNDLTVTAPSNLYALSHDSFADFVANEHINHTAVTLTAGTGLSGGGDISVSRTFNLDINGLDSDTITLTDEIVFYDTTGGDVNKVCLTNFNTVLNHDTLLNAHNLTTDVDHGSIGGLGDDDHIGYAFLLGRPGGQILAGGTQSGDDLTFQTTQDASKGSYIFLEMNTAGFLKNTVAGVVTGGHSVDISADTNLADTPPIVLTDDTLSLDYEATDFSVVGTTLTITDTGIDHDATTNYVAAKHIDWTNASDNFSTSGTVGIGTTVPREALHVSGDFLISGTSPHLRFWDTDSNKGKMWHYNSIDDWDGLTLWDTDDSGSDYALDDLYPLLQIDETNNNWLFDTKDKTLFLDVVNNRVGIRTASPSEELDVVGDAGVSGIMGIGIAPTAFNILRLDKTFTPGNAATNAIYSTSVTNASINNSKAIVGLRFTHEVGGTVDYTRTSGSGGLIGAEFALIANTSGTVSEATAFSVGLNTKQGTVTVYTGININVPQFAPAGGAVGTATGLNVSRLAVTGVTTAWAIVANDAIAIVRDDEKLLQGGGKDASWLYDGTDYVVNSSEVGTGTIKFNSANNWTANGAGTVTISNVAPAAVGTATIGKWFTVKDNGGNIYYIPAWN